MSDKTRKSAKKRIFDIIQIGNRNDLPSLLFDYFIVAVILLNITIVFLGTFDELSDYSTLFRAVETVTVGVFCIEYILRIWTADLLYPKGSYEDALSDVVQDARFYLDGEGVVFTADPYLIGPYSSGTIQFCLPYSALEGDLKENYLPAA